MDPDRRCQIENLYHAALELRPSEHQVFLEEACAGDEELRHEVESLLALDGLPGQISEPVSEPPAEIANKHHTPTLGKQLGPYQIIAKLGAGGMGEVYRARDSRLDRTVAIKVLPSHLRNSLQLKKRFEREAKAISGLNHPHICTLYDIGHESGVDYLVMEHLEGETLEQRLKKGPVPLNQALEYAGEIAGALAQAHEHGVLHRDLKPGNIMLTSSGTKLLDFGLAKLRYVGPLSEGSSLPTETELTGNLTGGILGTPAYMAPEQVNGEASDKRADIWAFGVVLYEMLSGERLFRGKTAPDTLAAVLTREIDWRRAPVSVHRLLRQCLERDPRRRLRDIGDAMLLLDDAQDGSPSETRTVRKSTRVLAWVAAGLLAAAVVGVSSWALRRTVQTQARPLIRINANLGPEAAPVTLLEPRISPDGARLAFVVRSADGQPRLAIRSLDGLQTTDLAGAENAASPFFSSDGQWIGFFAGGRMKKIAVQGGPAVAIADFGAGLGASWGDDQYIVFSPGTTTSLLRVSANGGTPQPLTKVGEKGDATHRWPQVLPGARAVLFTSHKIVTGFDDAQIEAVVVATGQRKTILKGGYFGRYVGAGASGGYLLYVHEGTLFGVPFDPESLTIHGAPSPMLEDVAGNSDTGAGQFDASGSGTLIYRSGQGPARKWPIVWMDSAGKTEPLLAEPGAYYTIRLSPDGNRLALTVDLGEKGREIAVYDWRRGSLSRLTFTGEVNVFPVWSPDGKYIVFESSSPRGYGIGLVHADGSGVLQRLAENDGLMIPMSFSPDGRRLAYHQMSPRTGFDIWTAAFDMSDPKHPRLDKLEPFLNTSAAETSPAFSPDGRWIAYSSTESGRSEVYVRPFPGPGGKVRVSTGGGGIPIWAPSGPHLYFRSLDGRIMVAGYTVKEDSFNVDSPRVWSDGQIGSTPFGRDLTLASDGKRFALIPPRGAPAEQSPVHVTFALNFLDELRRRLK